MSSGCRKQTVSRTHSSPDHIFL